MKDFNPNAVQAQVNVDLDQLETMKCRCGNHIFFNLYQLKHVSAFFTQTGQAQGIELKMYVCSNPQCGLMYGGAMEKSEIKKLARKPDAPRFNWVEFFRTGFNQVEEATAKLVAKVAEHAKKEEGLKNG